MHNTSLCTIPSYVQYQPVVLFVIQPFLLQYIQLVNTTNISATITSNATAPTIPAIIPKPIGPLEAPLDTA